MQSSNRSLQLWRECCRISKSESKIRSGKSAKSSSTPFTLSSQIIWMKWTPIRFAVSSNERSTSESKCDDGRFLHVSMYWWKVVFNVDSQFPSPIVLEQNQTTDTRPHHQIRRNVRRFSSVLRRFQRRNKKSLLRTAGEVRNCNAGSLGCLLSLLWDKRFPCDDRHRLSQAIQGTDTHGQSPHSVRKTGKW